MASISAQSEMDARGSTTTNISRESVVGHTGVMCDDCGCDHGAYAVTQRGAEYLLCEDCYHYACMQADAEPEVDEQYDDFQAEEPEPIDADEEWWQEAMQDARDNGAYDLLLSAGSYRR